MDEVFAILQNMIPFVKVDAMTCIGGIILILVILAAWDFMLEHFCMTAADLKHEAKVNQKKRNDHCDQKRKLREQGHYNYDDDDDTWEPF